MDIQFLLMLQQFREMTGGVFNSFFLFFTDLGWSILPMLIVSGIYWSIDKKAGRFLLTSIQTANYVANFTKLTACVYRPWIRDAAVQPLDSAFNTATGYSFPSGHTTVGTSLWGGIAVWYRRHKAIRIAGIVIIALIMFSRLYVGVHTPQDVLVACGIALFMLWVSGKLLQWLDKEPANYLRLLILSIVLFTVMALYASLKPYPMDYADGVLLVDPKKLALDGFNAGGRVLGFGIGLFLEHRYVNFTTETGTAERLGRFLCGGIVYAFIYNCLNGLLSLALPKSAAVSITEAFGLFFITFLFPLLFSLYETRHATAPVSSSL
ncbi:MAG: phosphatase PAP2 family protein [Lachnospiraceae bacterium]|jgi:membrane-associated phospholipid phosphatase|nr:phosphatase PAP2 family protein [Lachnospiraceae bacterium]